MPPKEVLCKILELSMEELCEVYDSVNSWKWDERLGEMPENFESLPVYNTKWYHKLFKRKTRYDYVHPICEVIRMIAGDKELLRYHHIHNLNSTNEEFEKFWNRWELEKATGLVLQPFEVTSFGFKRTE